MFQRGLYVCVCFILLACFLAQSAEAEVSGCNPEKIHAKPAVSPVGGSDRLNISAGFFDPDYIRSWDPPAQHLGVDLPGPEDSIVVSPISGRVLVNRTDRKDPFEKYLIVKSNNQAFQHVFGHINSPLKQGCDITAGDVLGTIVSAGTGPHVHWGVNEGEILSALGNGWGWGRAPLSASAQDAYKLGWIDPAVWFDRNKLGPSPETQTDYDPNLLFAEAVKLYGEALGLPETERRTVLAEVLAIIDRISAEFPESIPGKRLAAGRTLGPIDVAALRSMVEQGQSSVAAETPAEAGTSLKLPSTFTPDWVAKVVPKGKLGNGYHHGQFPSWGERTHAGVDIGGGCGLEVRAAAGGEVVKLVHAGDRDFDAVGNAVVIDHGEISGRQSYTAYFHLKERPEVETGPIVAGARLGKTGKTGAASGCHLHFEVRHFEGVRGLYHPEWANIYGGGDKSASDTFRNDWTNPAEWFASRSSPSKDDSIQFVFPKQELDQVAALSNDGELRSTGFNVDFTDRLSVNCTHWVTQAAGAASEYGITTWQALLPKLQCNVWSDNGDGSSGLVPNLEVSAELSNDGAMIIRLADAAFFQSERQGSQGPCAFSIQNQVFDYKKDWLGDCLSQTSTPTRRVEFTGLIDGLYGRSSENCSIDPLIVGDRWFSHFRSIRKAEISGGFESSCSVLHTTSKKQTTTITASCNTEGEFSERQFRWQILSASSFVDLDARGGPAEFRLCEAETATTTADVDEWTSAVVHIGGYGRGELTACLFNSGNRISTAECLRNDGASEATIRFAEVRAAEGGEGPEVPVDFKELGKVDIVFLDSFAMSQNEWEYFVNTSPESISAPMYPERDLRLLSSRGDRRAQAIIRQFPGATAWKPFVGGMRILPNGHQRFSTVVYWTENCRACPIVGYNLATVDFDQTGRFRAYETRGVFDNREHAKFMGMAANDLRRDKAAVQFYLNLRGYDAGPMDGALGPRTRAALSDFQRENNVSNGLGIPDQATLEALVNRETLFANGSGNALNLNSEHDTNEAVGPVAGNNVGSCVPVGNPRFPERLLPEEDSSTHRGRTINGDIWTVKLGSPGLRDGPSEFTNSAGVTVDGFWRTSNSGICQSYNERESWVCHDIFACDGEENLFAMRNSNGEFTSVIEGRLNGTTVYEVDASDIFGVLDSDPDTNEDRASNFERGIPGKYESPWKYMEWVQVASRQSLNEARDVSGQFMSEFPKTQIFKASNGWYAVVVDYIDDHFDNEKHLTELIGAGQVPRDAILTTGSNFTERFAAGAGTPLPTPEFVYATVVRDTRIGGETQSDGSRYVGQEVSRAGTEVGVSGRYGNDCNLSHHGLAIVPCSDLSGIDGLPDAAHAVAPKTESDPAQDGLSTEDYYQLFAEANGDDYMTRLVAATRWKDTPDQRASLLLVVKAAISRDEEYSPTRKASILLNVMHEASKLAGGDGDSFRIMNYARNSRNGEHPNIGTVLESGSSWEEADDSAKEFHIFGYDNPNDVRKFTHPDGREAVFFRDPQSSQWEIMQDGTNDATYNLVNGSLTSRNDFYQHMLLDVVPWIVYGVGPDDETSFTDRLTAFENSGPLAVATRLYPFFTKTGAELTAQVLEKLPSASKLTGPLRAWLASKIEPEEASSQIKPETAEVIAKTCDTPNILLQKSSTPMRVVNPILSPPEDIEFTDTSKFNPVESERLHALKAGTETHLLYPKMTVRYEKAINEVNEISSSHRWKQPIGDLNRLSAASALSSAIFGIGYARGRQLFAQNPKYSFLDTNYDKIVKAGTSIIVKDHRALKSRDFDTFTSCYTELSTVNRAASFDELIEQLEAASFLYDLNGLGWVFSVGGWRKSVEYSSREYDGGIRPAARNLSFGPFNVQGVPITKLRFKDVTGVFQSEAMAEVEFSLDEFGLIDDFDAKQEVASRGLDIGTKLISVREGRRTETTIGEWQSDNFLTAVFRKYDDGWRLWEIR